MQFTEEAKRGVNAALTQILDDERFRSSPQMSAFLRYVVQETLSGNQERIKAYTIAVDALGKPEDFDPQSNPSVRVLAKRLRGNLDDFYAAGISLAGPRIVLKPGSYIPRFELDGVTDEMTQDLSSAPESTPATEMPAQARAETAESDGVSGLTRKVSRWVRANHRQATIGGIMALALAVSSMQRTESPAVQTAAAEAPAHAVIEKLTVIDIASLEHFDASAERPPVPVLHLSTDAQHAPLRNSLEQSLNGFTHVIVDEAVSDGHAAWPEEYTVRLSSGAQSPAELTVTHALTHNLVAQLPLEDTSEGAIAELSRELLQNEGPLIRHYRAQGDITPTMRCSFLFDAFYKEKTRSNREAAESCLRDLQQASAGSLPPPVLL
ncbi:hypothetical protein Q4485_06890 [Granulosicoccaceae sp. 1_MG-2023]|nr:hypothetical protein [Granulosicoccaceae sp. 1_MG-2023]